MTGAEGRAELTEPGYEQLRRAAQTHREELLVRLSGEVGLRAAEVVRLRPADVAERGPATTGQRVTVREGGGEEREAYLRSRVAHDFWQYVRSNDIDPEEPVVDVSARRVQMLIRGVGERAAERAQRPALRAVTPSVLRRFFARRLLVREGVDPCVVTAVGGWEGVDGLLPDDEPTREEIAACFERADGASETARGRLSGVVDAIERVGEAIASATVRGDIEEAACGALTEGDSYDAAWVIDRDRHEEGIVERARAGSDPDRFRASEDATLIRQAIRTGRVLVAPDRPGPGEERGLLAAVPLVHGQTTYGALLVRAAGRGAFDDPERTALSDLGRRIGLTITAAERRQLLVGDTVRSLTLRYTDGEAVLVALSAELDCTVELEGIVAADARSLLCFLTVREAAPQDALEALSAADGVARARLVRELDEGALLELTVEDSSPTLVLTERGGTITDLRVDRGTATVVVEVAPDVGVRSFVDELGRQFPSVELRSKREIRPADRTPVGFRASMNERLTQKQRAVLRAAYHAGYFEWPRESTAEELAESMGVSSPTLHNHLRRAQQKLLGVAFDESARSETDVLDN